MVDIEQLKQDIVERFRPLHPEKVILFGSFAYGTPHDESDIDVYVVTKDDFMPKDFREESKIFLEYSNTIRNLQKSVSIDLITHTKKMHTKFMALNGAFSKEILQKGIRLL